MDTTHTLNRETEITFSCDGRIRSKKRYLSNSSNDSLRIMGSGRQYGSIDAGISASIRLVIRVARYAPSEY